MGAETTCTVTVKGRKSTATVRLETHLLQVRSTDLRLDIPFNAMTKVVARDGAVSIGYGAGTLTLALGESADKWADRILNPASRSAKIGVRPNWRVAVIGSVDVDFIDELRAAGATLTVGRVIKNADAVFVVISRPSDFERVAVAKSSIKPTGAVWLIRPQGSLDVPESAVMAAGKAVGLVDVKVVGFSATHSALKFVIPVKNRPG
jgi:hypothetical protein